MMTSSPEQAEVSEHIASLRRNGFALIPAALDSETVQQLYDMLHGHYLAADQDGLNEVG
ncbi:MAG: hypothetical protein HRU15_12285, partial [Planctomycetes bacterium]|nr:hypothetical protein [Planctomycetota bacterium]